LAFTKMHGLGNDYVYVGLFAQDVAGVDWPALSREISDRHRGIGSDGLILIRPAGADSDAAARMEMYNADGSRGEMCGNGIRCVAKYVCDRGIVPGGGDEVPLRIETDRGVLDLVAYRDGTGAVDRVRVAMGAPILRPADIPVRVEGDRCIRAPLTVDGERFAMTCVSMGNPHAVIFVESVAAFDLKRWGPLIEAHRSFPHRTNVHVCECPSRREAAMRTWERGSGITQACGTGACAVLVAGVLEDRLDRSATIHLPGGDLDIAWSGDGDSPGTVFKSGPAVEVFSGNWPLSAVRN
jgi:diaminopimelate epimerase